MTRLLILLLFMLWLVREPGQLSAQGPSGITLLVFLGVYALLVIGMGAWGRRLARRVAAPHFQRSLRRFNISMELARILVPTWFGVGIFALGWAMMIERWLGPPLVQSALGVLLGTLPAFLAWMGLWWAQYPADRAMREQNLLALLDTDLPMHAPPSFGSYVASNLRLQLLFIGVPVLLILLGHDLGRLLIWSTGLQGTLAGAIDTTIRLLSAAVVFVFAPEILRRVLRTEPLPDSPLRRRLEAFCRRTEMRYRDLLLWKTDYNMGNAAVMGFVPRLRYILLSDVLLEQMPDDEIEAVFAHEMGHVVHRHMLWYVVFIVELTLINAGPGEWVGQTLSAHLGHADLLEPAVAALFIIGQFLLLFGFVSRRLERQADVFAARTLQLNRALQEKTVTTLVPSGALAGGALAGSALGGDALAGGGTFALGGGEFAGVFSSPLPASDTGPAAGSDQSYVGPYGARVFASALRRVAMVNNIPISARSWCHGSIAARMEYLIKLSVDPQRTDSFDRFMFWMYAAMIFALVLSGIVVLFGT